MVDARSSPEQVERLANVKRLFRSAYGLELSETMLGYTKLSDLLQDPRLSDLCSVELRNRGYAVVPRPLTSTNGVGELNISLLDAVEAPPTQAVNMTTTPSHVSPSMLSKNECMERVAPAGTTVKNTFIEQPSSPIRELLETCEPRSKSLPKDFGSKKSEWEMACHALRYQHCNAAGVGGVGSGAFSSWSNVQAGGEMRSSDSTVMVNRVSGDCAPSQLAMQQAVESLSLTMQPPEVPKRTMTNMPSLSAPHVPTPVKTVATRRPAFTLYLADRV